MTDSRRILGQLAFCCIALLRAAPITAAVTFTTTHAPGGHDLDGMMSGSDVLQGLIAAELPGDLGWHPVNPAASNSLHPWGLPAFTDGLGAQGVYYGLLNDVFAPAVRGEPAKRLQYDLAQPTNVTGVNIFTGNINNADGRIFSTTVIRYSTNNGGAFNLLGYFQSDPSGSINNESGVPGTTENMVTLVSIVDDAAGNLAAGVTNLQFDFYAVDNTGGQLRDPFGSDNDVEAMDPNLPININPFTNASDGLTAAFVSPLVWEIDVFGVAGAAASADFDDDDDVDGADFVTWQRGLGLAGATRSQGDADGDQDVDADDLDVWKNQFKTTPPLVATPEPATATGLLLAAVLIFQGRRRRFRHAAGAASRA